VLPGRDDATARHYAFGKHFVDQHGSFFADLGEVLLGIPLGTRFFIQGSLHVS
jgi:hypothetical protein